MSLQRSESVARDTVLASRARRMLARPAAWLSQVSDGRYGVRLTTDRRTRPVLILDEPTFRALIERPGLRALPDGGWVARTSVEGPQIAPAAAPGRILGHRGVMEDDGRLLNRPANLGESSIAWLARRRDADGQPWLAPAEVAAADRLRRDAEAAMSGPSLTMRWDALPRAGGGSAARMEPGDRALSAGRRAALALEACGPRCRAFVEQACIRDTALQAAERALGVPRRQGKRLLKEGLQALARHYGIG